MSNVVNVSSFGYKWDHVGPTTATVIDCRDVNNPYYIKKLRSLTGLAFPVQEFVFDDVNAKWVLATAWGYYVEGDTDIAFGCTGGHHRSVAIAEAFSKMLTAVHQPNIVTHLHIDKESH